MQPRRRDPRLMPRSGEMKLEDKSTSAHENDAARQPFIVLCAGRRLQEHFSAMCMALMRVADQGQD